jgi:uncharacterized membrane protein YeaQ/YmgE (transglycosylase-associated protein family)
MYISGQSLIVILFVGLIAGWLAGKVVRGSGFGIIGDIVIGIAGAFVASFLFPKLGIHIGRRAGLGDHLFRHRRHYPAAGGAAGARRRPALAAPRFTDRNFAPLPSPGERRLSVP